MSVKHSSNAHDNHAKHDPSKYRVKRDPVLYCLFRGISNLYARVKFKRSFLRNEIKGKKGPMVIIANHAAALDFVNLIGASSRPMNFVISRSFYNTIPLPFIMPRLGLIPKQQFQTELKDLHKMKWVVDNGGILVIYPSGLMSEDGTPTPTPAATYSFLKWLKCDVYMAKNIGTYFVMPKWRKDKPRTGRTYIDIYKIIDKEELSELDEQELRRRADNALYFDAYEEQEEYKVKYKRGGNIEGLENVLFLCPHCKKEFTIKSRDIGTLYCESCGYEERSDEYGFLHKVSDVGPEIRHPSKWNSMIHDTLKEQILSGALDSLSTKVKIHMIPKGKRCFKPMGEGLMTLCADHFTLTGNIGGEPLELSIPTATFASLPYRPGEYLEIQDADRIYRCQPEDGRKVIKFIDMVEIFYEIHVIHTEEDCRRHAEVAKVN